MGYSNNPNLASARGRAVKEVIIGGLSVAVVARKYGVHRSTVYRWIKRWREINKDRSFVNYGRPNRPVGVISHACYYKWSIPTLSSRPHRSPTALADWIVERILTLRRTLRRCAEVIWHCLTQEGIQVSLSSVRRTLAKHHEYDRPKHKKKLYRRNIKRPSVKQPGDLVEIDVVHLVDPSTRTRKYVYTVIDLATRMSYARVFPKLSPTYSLQTILEAERYMGFKFKVVQADNGSEFNGFLRDRLNGQSITLRHTRPHRPNDNAHIERFNRTLRKECVGNYMSETRTFDYVQSLLNSFLDFYNHGRIHLGLNYKTPASMKDYLLQRC